jgi:integrase
MASIKQRTSGYQAQVRRKGFPTLSRMFASRKDAEAWARMIESDMDRGTFLDRTEAERTTLGELLKKYQKEISPRKRAGAIEVIRINRFLNNEKLCSYKASALTGKLLSEWRDKRLKEVSGSSVNRELNLLSHAINIARKEWGIHISNPVEYIQRPKNNQPRERRLQGDELKQLLAELNLTDRNEQGHFMTGGTHNPWLKPLVLIAIETGMRQSELLSLTWHKVDLAKRTATLDQTKNGSRRVVPLSNAAKTVLEALPRSIDGKVFPTSREAVKRGFNRAVERAGIPDLHFHDLRHEATSRLFEIGLNVMEVATITGHKTLSMLMRYTHIRPESLLAKIG